MGELLGLTWDCVNISEEALDENRPNIFINKEVQRVSKTAVEDLDGKGMQNIVIAAMSDLTLV